MLQIGEYTKQLLFSMMGSKNIGIIKRKLLKDGYTFITNGHTGNNYKLTITSVPVSFEIFENFRKLCIDELNTPKNIDFYKLAIVIYFLAFDKDFLVLTLEQMEQRIKSKGYIISYLTISKYFDILKQANILSYLVGLYVYFVPLCDGNIKYITKELWSELWLAYYDDDSYTYNELLTDIGGRPKKREALYFGNALVPYWQKLVYYSKEIIENDS